MENISVVFFYEVRLLVFHSPSGWRVCTTAVRFVYTSRGHRLRDTAAIVQQSKQWAQTCTWSSRLDWRGNRYLVLVRIADLWHDTYERHVTKHNNSTLLGLEIWDENSVEKKGWLLFRANSKYTYFPDIHKLLAFCSFRFCLPLDTDCCISCMTPYKTLTPAVLIVRAIAVRFHTHRAKMSLDQILDLIITAAVFKFDK